MKQVIKKIVFSKVLAKLLLKPLLKLHSFSYSFAGMYSVIINDGVHPKHKIMEDKEWFLGKIKEDSVVLDVGSNTGLLPLILSQKAKYVYGIEIVESLVVKAKNLRQRDNIEYICADATTYDYSNCQAIDYITMSNVLEHIDNRVDFLKKLILQVKWNNKKRFLIRVPMINREWIAVYKKELGLEYRLDSTHFIEYIFEEFKAELNEAKIGILDYHIKFGELYAVCEAK